MTKLPQPYYRQGLLADHTEHGVAEAIRAGRGGAKVKELFRARARPPHLAGQFLAAEVAGGLLMIAILALAGVLGWRFLRTGGREMLRMMEAAPTGGHEMAHHDHHDDHDHHPR